MATTTNYAWETPDDTDLVKDGAAAIRTLGSSIDTTTKALNPSTTLGDIEYRSSTANTNTRLGIGSTGQVLTVSGGVPAWATPAGGGKVLQVVQGTTTTETTIATTDLTDTGITATITPSSTSSKILVMVMALCGSYRDADGQFSGAAVLRGGTTILDYNTDKLGGIGVGGGTFVFNRRFVTLNYLDSPSTTSATTYKMQGSISTTANNAYIKFQNGGFRSTIILMEIGA
jgi:hypothetical protein